jgi:hypothetical protein
MVEPTRIAAMTTLKDLKVGVRLELSLRQPAR